MNRPKTRTGRLSQADMRYIYDNAKEKTDEQLAVELNRTVKCIRDYRRKLGQTGDAIEIVLNQEFKAKYFYPILKKQFDKDELERMEQAWVNLHSQFGDVTNVEEMQMLDLIKTDVLIDRILVEKHNVVRDSERLENLIDQLRRRYSPDELIPDDVMAQIMELNNQLAGLKSVSSAKTREQSDLMQRKEKAYHQLKATRDQRLENLESETLNFLGMLRGLSDPKRRKAESRVAELGRIAMEKARKELGDLHTFADGEPDQPLLSSETVGRVKTV